MRQERHQDKSNLLKVISEKAELEESGEAVRKILREVFRNQKISTKELARCTQLPVPVTAAVRRELENEGLLFACDGLQITIKFIHSGIYEFYVNIYFTSY